jgi:serine/threonine protein kinase
MARLYLAKAEGIGSFERYLVVKLILRDRAGDSNAVRMLLDEARLAATLHHHNVAQVYEVGEDAGLYYLAMEYVHGVDLRRLLGTCLARYTPLPLPFALTIAAGVASGLHHAHERRGADGRPLDIVHRDVSPSNVMIAYDGAVKLVDFGLAKAAERSADTRTGVIKGKLSYLSPEQVRGRPADRRSDVFALGVTLYEMTTMRRAFRGRTEYETMQIIASAALPRPGEVVVGYPSSLEAVVMKSLAVDPDARYQSAGEVLAGIEQVAAEQRVALSNVALAHYMHELFGDVAEPWLVTARKTTREEAVVPDGELEHTSSDADGLSNTTRRRIRPPSANDLHTAAEAPRARRRSSGPPVPIPPVAPPLVQAVTPSPMVDPGGWSPAKSDPGGSSPALASTRTIPPAARSRARASSRHGYDAPSRVPSQSSPPLAPPLAPPALMSPPAPTPMVPNRSHRVWLIVILIVIALTAALATVAAIAERGG